jgi:serine/threonine protein kinase
MNADPNQKCPRCERELPASGVCPRCAADFLQATPSAASEGEHAFVAPSPADLAAKFPKLEILSFIGQGGMGAVYKARQKALDRLVALKILPPGLGKDPAFAERFTREAKAMARLNHPGVVTIYEFGQADGLFFFLMEYVDGMSLRHLLEVERISTREALAIVPQICDALQYAHDQGIVHRDIKPENILLDRQRRVKVADFGLVKMLGADALTQLAERAPPSEVLTNAGKVMGTPQYMAPEQREDPAKVDHRADIYSLGVVFYQMLTGELPGKPIEAPSCKIHIDVRLDEVVLRALENEPRRRYQQASQVKSAVSHIGASDSVETRTAVAHTTITDEDHKSVERMRESKAQIEAEVKSRGEKAGRIFVDRKQLWRELTRLTNWFAQLNPDDPWGEVGAVNVRDIARIMVGENGSEDDIVVELSGTYGDDYELGNTHWVEGFVEGAVGRFEELNAET